MAGDLNTPSNQQKPKSNKQWNNNLVIGVGLIGLFLWGGQFSNGADITNKYEVLGSFTAKILLYCVGTFFIKRGLTRMPNVKQHQRMFISSGLFLFLTIFLTAFSMGVSSNRDEEGFFSDDPIVNISKIVSLIPLVIAMIYAIKGFRAMNLKQ